MTDDNDRLMAGTFDGDPQSGGTLVDKVQANGTQAQEDPRVDPWGRWNWNELERNPFPAREYLVADLVVRGAFFGWQGRPKTNKSTSAIHLGMEATKEKGQLFGRHGPRINGGPYHVVMLGQDMLAHSLVDSIFRQLGMYELDTRERFSYIHDQRHRLDTDEGYERLAEMIHAQCKRPAVAGLPLLVLGDALKQLENGEQNDNDHRDAVCQRLKKIVGDFDDATVGVVAHETIKEGGDGTIRGGSAIHDNVDVSIRFKRVDNVGFAFKPRDARHYDADSVPWRTVVTDYDMTANAPWGRCTMALDPDLNEAKSRKHGTEERELKILEAFTEPGATCTGPDMQRRTGIPARTCRDIRKRLEAQGMVTKDGDDWQRTALGKRQAEALKKLASEAEQVVLE